MRRAQTSACSSRRNEGRLSPRGTRSSIVARLGQRIIGGGKLSAHSGRVRHFNHRVTSAAVTYRIVATSLASHACVKIGQGRLQESSCHGKNLLRSWG